ncbi:MAG: hypothetical protein MSS51_08635 [Bacteroidales bacterium]|nr:hypothetical protein [Bacteroidales bacterium]
MNEKLNLVKILKDAPKGTKLWSPICGECELSKIVNDEDVSHPIICRTNLNSGDFGRESFSADGKFSTLYKNAECVLFPSKENRDWSTFKAPNTHKHFEPFQKVLRAIGHEFGYEVWFADFYSHYDDSTREHYLASGYVVDDDEIVPFEGNEDKLGKLVR